MAGADNRRAGCPRHLMQRGTLSPHFISEILIPMLDEVNAPLNSYNWRGLACKLMPHLRKIDFEKFAVTAKDTSTNNVKQMLEWYKAHRGMIDGYELWEALHDIGREDIVREMERFGFENVFMVPNKTTDYERLSGQMLQNHECLRTTDAPQTNCEKLCGATAEPEKDFGQLRGPSAGPQMDFGQHLGATAAPQIDFVPSCGASALPQMDFEQPLGASAPTRTDPQEGSYYSEQSMEIDSETEVPDNHFLPRPLRGLTLRRSFGKSTKKRNYQNSTAYSASTVSSDEFSVDRNSAHFENFDGVMRGCWPGVGSLENEASSRNGQPSVFGDNVEANTLVGISFAERDRPLAELLEFNLESFGCRPVFITKKQLSTLNKMDAILVIYSYHYKEQNKPAFPWKRSCIRSVFEFLQREYSTRGGNQRCIFYPTFEVKGHRLPSMFLNCCPRGRKARQVWGNLFRRADMS